VSRDRLMELLEQCLLQFEAGLSPEECLAAFPEERDLLEPLFRQALSLRVAFSGLPAEGFKRAARERTLVAAGRDVGAAFAAEPEPGFAASARRRLLNAAGAQAQEALRAVPPPRLPFWVNARRRLLEAAAMSARPAARPMALAFRTALSGSVAVLALALLALVYLTLQNGTPRAAADELAQIEQELQVVEQQASNGKISVSVIFDLAARTNQVVDKFSSNPAGAQPEKLQEIIDRQADLLEQVSPEEAPQEVAETKEQLDEAEAKVTSLAARIEPTATATPTSEPSPEPSPSPAQTPSPTPKPKPLESGQVRVSALRNDTTLALTWYKVETTTLSFAIPSTWQVAGLTLGSGGVGTFTSEYMRIDGAIGEVSVILLANLQTGQITAILGDDQVNVRGGGADGQAATLTDLISVVGDAGPVLFHIGTSAAMAETEDEEEATATPRPSATPTRTATPTPAEP